MSRWINIDDDRNCYCGDHGEYENWNIDPDVLKEASSQLVVQNIIRCKDCIYANLSPRGGYCHLLRIRCKENDYCCYAERVEYERIKAGIYEF